MHMTRLLKISLFLIAILLNTSIIGQTGGRSNCSDNLKQAQTAYDNGLIQDVPNLIEKCIPNYTKTQKTQAYRLLILSYLFDNKYDLADKYMQSLLKFDPLFLIQEDEPIELRNLFSNYRTEPIYSIGVIGGGTISFVDIIYPYNTVDIKQATTNFSALPSFEIMAYFNAYISDNFKLNLTTSITQNRYNINLNQEQLNFADTKLKESLVFVGLGIAGTYEMKKIGKTVLKPYIRIGVEPNYLIIANISGERIYTDGTKPPVEDQGIVTLDIRNKFNVAPFLASGIKYRIGRAWILVDLKYSRNIFYTNSPENRYDNKDLLFKYYYVDSDFAMQYFSLNFGIIQSFYNPIKK